MKTILVDDERWGLERFEIECKNISEVELLGKFRNAADALAFAQENRVDLALLDIEMPGMNGMALSDKLKELYPDIIIIFVSAYDQHMRSAMKEHDADWFLLKPYTTEEVQRALERAKLLSQRQKKRVEIHTFGNFEVLVDGEALKFTSKLAKEILAILVDGNGDSMSYESIYRKMWPEQEYSSDEASHFRHAMLRLQKTLHDAGIENIILYHPQARALKCDQVDCDYFSMLREEPEAIRKYLGKYMRQYSWSEERISLLESIKLRYDPHAAEILYSDS